MLIAIDGSKVMDLGTALEIVLNTTKEHYNKYAFIIGPAKCPADMEEALKIVEDFIVNNFEEEEAK